MIIYIDVLLFVNAIVNYAILMTSEKVLKREIRLYRILSGAFVGALFSLIIFIRSDSRVLLFVLRLIGTALITLIVFGVHSKREFLRSYLCNTIVAVIYCGAYILFYQLFKPPNVIIVNDILYVQVNPLMLLALTAVIYLTVILLYKLFSERIKGTVASLHFTVRENEYSCIGKIDTGCNLREPFSFAPVIIIDPTVMNTEQEAFIRIIPYSTVNGGSYLKAVRADRVQINKRSISETVYIATGNINNPHYQAIINSEIIR